MSSPKTIIWEKISDHIFRILGEFFLKVEKQLNDIFRSCHQNVNLTVVLKSPNRIRNAFRFKEQFPKSINSKVLYKYSCDTCNSVCIGKTKRYLSVRQYEHLGTSIFTNKLLKYTEKSATAIRKHCYQHQHNSRLDNLKVLANAINNVHLQLKESLLILKIKSSLNFAKESMSLYLFDKDCQILSELNNDLRTGWFINWCRITDYSRYYYEQVVVKYHCLKM